MFLVLEGQCEFLVEDARVTCGPGQLIYVEPLLKHTLHAVGDVPCVVYPSVTPHVEPTHTQYDEDYRELPPRYGTWRGTGQGDPHPTVTTAQLVQRYAQASPQLAELARANAESVERHLEAFEAVDITGNLPALKEDVDALWFSLRGVHRQLSALEHDWNALAPRAMREK